MAERSVWEGDKTLGSQALLDMSLNLSMGISDLSDGTWRADPRVIPSAR